MEKSICLQNKKDYFTPIVFTITFFAFGFLSEFFSLMALPISKELNIKIGWIEINTITIMILISSNLFFKNSYKKCVKSNKSSEWFWLLMLFFSTVGQYFCSYKFGAWGEIIYFNFVVNFIIATILFYILAITILGIFSYKNYGK